MALPLFWCGHGYLLVVAPYHNITMKRGDRSNKNIREVHQLYCKKTAHTPETSYWENNSCNELSKLTLWTLDWSKLHHESRTVQWLDHHNFLCDLILKDYLVCTSFVTMHTTSTASHTQQQVHQLFVGDLSKDCTVEELTTLFTAFGNISIRMKYAKITCHPLGKTSNYVTNIVFWLWGFVSYYFKLVNTTMTLTKLHVLNTIGYCFVDFEDRSDAERALESTNGLVLHNKKLQVRWGMRNKNLFINGVPKSAKWNEVISLFAEYGAIDTKQSRVVPTSKNSYCGVVSYCSREHAQLAKDSLDGWSFLGHRLSVKWEQLNSSIYNDNDNDKVHCNDEENQFETSSAAAVTAATTTTYTQHPHFSVHISFQAAQVNACIN